LENIEILKICSHFKQPKPRRHNHYGGQIFMKNMTYLILGQKTSPSAIACCGAIIGQKMLLEVSFADTICRLMSSNMWAVTGCPGEYLYYLPKLTMFLMMEDPRSRSPSIVTEFKLETFTGEQLVLSLSLTGLEPWKTWFGRPFDHLLRK
jgi:hypothetical protein